MSQFGLFFKDGKTAIATALVIVGLSIVAGWIPDGLSEILFEGNWKKGFFMFGMGIFILSLLTFYAWKYSKEGKFEAFDNVPDKKKVLILFLSAIAPGGNPKEAQTLMEEVKNIPDKEVIPFKEKVVLVQNNPLLRSWRMPLEAIEHHQQKLEKLILITSPQSSNQLVAFKELINRFFGKKITNILIEAEVSNFENIKEIFNTLDKIYEDLEKEGYKNKDVIIDVTGGQKTNSIAGAFMTLLYDREFQYISTNTKELKSYDVRLITDD